MRTLFCLILAISLAGTALVHEGAAQTAAASGVAGTWDYTIETPDEDLLGSITLQEANGALSGTLNDTAGRSYALEALKLEADSLAFESVTDFGRAAVRLAADGERLSGLLSLPDYGNFPMQATRRAAVAPAATRRAAVAPAASDAKAGLNTNSKLKELFASEQARAVLDKHLPGLTTSPEVEQAMEMSLREIAPYAPDFFTDAALQALDEDLAKL